jgi:sugar phosphate isomerase/epimerase
VNVQLGINTCFTATRWPRPEEKFRLVREVLGLDYVQYSLDAFDAGLSAGYRTALYRRIRAAAEQYGIRIHSTFTGAGHHFDNLLFHPEPEWRANSRRWFEEAIRLSAAIGARGLGAFFGAMSVDDNADPVCREVRIHEAVDQLVALSETAKVEGLDFLMIEPMSVWREPPSTLAEARRMLDEANRAAAVPIRLCLDVGHHLAVTAPTPADCDPYAWIAEFGAQSPALHIQQTDMASSKHWTFSEANNQRGIIQGEKLLAALTASGADETLLLIELFHSPYEPMDDQVLDDLRISIDYWRRHLAAYRRQQSLQAV